MEEPKKGAPIEYDDVPQKLGLMSIFCEGYEALEKKVKKSGNTGRIYLPADWIGTKVKVIRLEPNDSES